MKNCSRCKKDLPDNSFRTRLDKRDGLVYLNNTCKICEKELAKEYYDRKKSDPSFKEKNAFRVRKRYYSEHEKVLNQAKKHRSTDSAKQRRKRYDAQHRDTIKKKHKVVNKKYNEKNKDQCSFQHAKKLLKQDLVRKGMPLIFTDADVEIKRSEILLHRLQKRIKRHEK